MNDCVIMDLSGQIYWQINTI